MKATKFLMTLCAAAACTFAGAQGLEDVIVEKYYITNAADAADPDAGDLPAGATVYRVFIDMAPGYVLESVFGNSTNPLTIATTTEFFNNEDRGDVTGNDLGTNFLNTGTVLIDSYVSMGAGGEDRWAVLKTEDPNGSIGNVDNLIRNQSNRAGIPPRINDGLIPGSPPAVTIVGDADDVLSDEFDDVNGGPVISINNGAWAVLGGTAGPDAENRVLVAQITTDGELSFELNVRLGAPDDGPFEQYVAANPVGDDQLFEALSYPNTPPCENPYPQATGLVSDVRPNNNVYLSWDPILGSVGCIAKVEELDGTLVGAKTITVPEVNLVIVPNSFLEPATDYRWTLRCGCSLNPFVVAPFAPFGFFSTNGGAIVNTFPNPTEGQSNVTFTVPAQTEATLEVYDMSGRKVAELYNGLADPSSEYRFQFDGSYLPNGVYIYRLTTDTEVTTEKFMIAR